MHQGGNKPAGWILGVGLVVVAIAAICSVVLYLKIGTVPPPGGPPVKEGGLSKFVLPQHPASVGAEATVFARELYRP